MTKDYWLQDDLDDPNNFHSLDVIKKDNSNNVFLRLGSETFKFYMEEK